MEKALVIKALTYFSILFFAVGVLIGGTWFASPHKYVERHMVREWCVKTIATEVRNQGGFEGRSDEELNEFLTTVRTTCVQNFEEFEAWVEEQERSAGTGPAL